MVILVIAISSVIILLKLDYRLLFELGRDIPKLERPISKKAIKIIKENKKVIKELSRKYEFSEIAIAGIVLTELSFDPGPVDAWEEWRIKDKYLKKSNLELNQIYQQTEDDINERLENGENQQEFLFKLSRPLVWSIGVCQITSIRGLKIEKNRALKFNSKPRDLKKVIELLLIPENNIEYCAQELYDISRIYSKYAKIDISQRPEILGTLFNTGNAIQKAKAYINNPSKKPEPNEFGKYIKLHSNFISNLLNETDSVKVKI